MRMVIKDANMKTAKIYEVSVDGVDYVISLAGYISRHGFAECYVHDKTNNKRYHSEGRVETDRHIISTYWDGVDFDIDRSRYVPSRQLIIMIE
jgi:hypothetical protein